MKKPKTIAVVTTIKLHDGSRWVIPALLTEDAIRALQEHTSVFDEPPVEPDESASMVDADEGFGWDWEE